MRCAFITIIINNRSLPMLEEQSLADYLNALASHQPTPGGGTAAAITGAQGAALLSMVCQLTLGNARFAAIQGEIASISSIIEPLRLHLLALAEEDMRVFQAVMATYQLPKDTDAAKAMRTAALQQALKNAANTPFNLFKTCLELLPIADRLEEIANPSVLSDVIVGRHLLFAAILSAKVNVEVNLAAIINDTTFCQEKRNYMRDALASAACIAYGRFNFAE
jgi:methenyltetrahydrofolate cyclohydrolase